MMICRRYKTFILMCVMIFLCAFLSAQNRRAVLAQGNSWITENNPFADGTYTFLFGEYRTETYVDDSAQTPPVFFVRVSGNNSLLETGGWQPRTGALRQRQEKSNLYIGFPYTGGGDLGTRTILFQFPLTDNPPNDAVINRIIETWTGRFRYFFSLIKVESDMSMPAVINF